MGGSGEIELDRDVLDELRASFRGELVRPADPTYDEHRKVWNGSIDRHPAVIARCTGNEDVAIGQDIFVDVDA